MTISIRPATAGDQAAITALVKSEHLNTTDLDWRRFTLAVVDDAVIGAVQVSRNRDGSRELGSLVVVPAMRGQKIAGRLIDAALATAGGEDIWIVTPAAFVGHYRKWGFSAAWGRNIPLAVRLHHRLGRSMAVVSWLKGRKGKNLTVLVRPASGVLFPSAGAIRHSA